jgi:hypothetical protein
MIDGNYILTDTFRQAMFHFKPPANGYFFDASGANGIPEFMFGKGLRMTNVTLTVSDYDEEPETSTDDNSVDQMLTVSPAVDETSHIQIISYVPLIRLRYSLMSSTATWRQLSIEWERAAFRFLTEQYHSSLIQVSVSTSTAITDTVAKKAHDEGVSLSIMLVTFFVLVCILLGKQGNAMTGVGLLPVCSILSTLLATGATFGLLAIAGIDIVEPMALLVLVVASKFH